MIDAGYPITALHDMRPIIVVATAPTEPPPPPSCNFCGAGSWNENSPAWCDHEPPLTTAPRATKKWVCVMCDHQSDEWQANVRHLYLTGHGFVITEQGLPPEPAPGE